MNRLILIGNGFDLAHGLKTGYNDFILAYLTNCFKIATGEKNFYEDELISIRSDTYYVQRELKGKSIEEYLLEHYKNSTLGNIVKSSGDAISAMLTYTMNRRSHSVLDVPFSIHVKSDLLRSMVDNCGIDRWVDIENLFYSLLKKALSDENGTKAKKIKELNQSLTFIIEELRVYLLNLGICDTGNSEYGEVFKSSVDAAEIVERAPMVPRDLESHKPEKTLILNFNYTAAVEQYIKDDPSVTVNYIHGQLSNPNNPMIFGFGDELDSEYAKFEVDKTKEIFKYIKSFWYFKTSNYHNLLRFIQANTFQVYIMGHSCGLSDRTMLNMIFEHENCLSIKIFYYQNPSTGFNNYTELTEEISRHFKDKRQMRLKIVPLDQSSPMPQISRF